jgi:hypothetical protein
MSFKYLEVSTIVRARIDDGTLRPGQPAPSGAELARDTGFSSLTCRKALRALISDGVLVPGLSRNARPRVASIPGQTGSGHGVAAAARTLSSALAALRREAGLRQAELAELVGFSVTTVGHAETGSPGSPGSSGRAQTSFSARAGICSVSTILIVLPSRRLRQPGRLPTRGSPPSLRSTLSGPTARSRRLALAVFHQRPAHAALARPNRVREIGDKAVLYQQGYDIMERSSDWESRVCLLPLPRESDRLHASGIRAATVFL